MADLFEQIEEEINNYHSLEELRNAFIEHGYLEKDIDEAVAKLARIAKHGGGEVRKSVRVFTFKEIFDRIGYGLVANQYINILFMLSGAGLFLIGLISAIKNVFTIFFSSFLKEYSQVHDISKGFISKSGIIFGITFLIIALAVSQKNPALFSIALLVGIIGVVTYGDMFYKLMKETLKRESMNPFLVRVSYYGILITIVTMLISGYILERFPVKGTQVLIMGNKYPVYGYLISFELAALAFILSGYFLYYLDFKPQKMKYDLGKFTREFFARVSKLMGSFTQKKQIFLLLIAMVITASVQILGNSYYGIYIYDNFKNAWLGGFMNIAVIFSFALLVSFIGPVMTRQLHKSLGLSPMLVFGTLLIALMPFTMAYNASLLAIGVASSLSVLGSVIIGLAQGLLARRLLKESERKQFFATLGLSSIIPFLIIIPLGAYYAQSAGLQNLFSSMGIILVLIVVPVYLILVSISRKPTS